MTHKELLKLLTENDILFVVIGGVAMRVYASPRPTSGIDLAVRTLDVDAVLELLYSRSYYLITQVDADRATIALDAVAAAERVESEKAGAMSLAKLRYLPRKESIPLEEILAESQVNVFFEPGVPIARLAANAQTVELPDVSFRVAAVEDLITMEERRPDGSEAEGEDLRFLRRLLRRGS